MATESPITASNDKKLARSIWVRWLCIGLAWLCIALGILGIFIPGLPTVDFIILATFFAAKGSRKLHNWLLQNRLFGSLIREWQQHRKIPKKAKYFSTMSMSIAAIVMIYTIPHPYFVYPAIICMGGVLIWIWLKA